MKSNLLVIVGVLFVIALGLGLFLLRRPNPSGVTPAPPAVTSESSGFRDIANDAGLNFKMGFLPSEQGENFKINLYDHGCGLAVGDYDGDGHDDVYFLNQLGANALYRNRGDGTFEDVTEAMGVGLGDRICVGATFSDYDNDGDQDLYVTSTRGGNVLYRNEDNQKLVNATEAAGLKHVGHSQTAVFFDYDRDSLLDLFLVQTSEWTVEEYDSRSGYFPGKGGAGGLDEVVSAAKEKNILYRNRGDGTFEDVTEAAQLSGRGWSGDVAVFDYDQDGWQDLLVVCMFGRAQLYRNRQDGTFEDVTLSVLGKTPFGGIGAKIFDFNNDGLLDIYIVDMHSDMWMGLDESHSSFNTAVESEKIKFNYVNGPRVEDSEEFQKLELYLQDVLQYDPKEVVYGNAFYKALGDGKFAEVSDETNLETFWPWGIAAGDFDNNGYNDAFVASGMGYPFYYWRNYLMMNDGTEILQDESFGLGVEPPVGGNFLPEKIKGQDCPRSSRCAVTADFNRDGKIDIITNNFNHGPYYYQNEFPDSNFIAFRLQGTQSNRDAIGAIVRLKIGEQTLVRQIHAAGGYLSHSSKTLHFGLGDLGEIDSIEVTWPNGLKQNLDPLEIGKEHLLVEPAS